MSERKQKVPAVQWATAALGALVVLASLLFLGRKAMSGDESGAAIVVSSDAPRPAGNGHAVRIHVTNTGGATATGVLITGSLRSGATVLETSQITLDHVAPGVVRHGALFFTRDPASFRLELRPSGYIDP